ncbi:unnamed protein product, partial [Rotaria magnacalcarata]
MREDCINHVQKRVSSRLKDAWSKYSHVQSRRISITTTTEQVSSERLTKRGVFLSDVWSILSKTKHHGYKSIFGAAALACLYFNNDRSGFIDYFKHINIDVNDELMIYILA